MAQVALKREIEAYRDTIDKYNQQARQYTSEAKTHNAAVDAYNQTFVKDAKGNPAVLHGGGRSGWLYDQDNKPRILRNDPKYNVTLVQDMGRNGKYYAANTAGAVKPAEFTLQEPESPGADPASQATAAQMARLNTIGLAEQERGLISNALRY